MKRKLQILLNKICPEIYNRIVFKIKNGYGYSLSNPITFNEKIQWRKKYQHDSRFPKLVDKWEVRTFVSQVYPEILVPSYGVFEKAEEINYDDLPEQFIMKPTHGFGKVIICTDKKKLDIDNTNKIINGWLKYNQFSVTGEWQYKNLKPRIIIDRLLGENINDYKIFCFHGKPFAIQVDTDRFISHKRQILNTNWEKMPCSYCYPIDDTILDKPSLLDEMLIIASELSKGFDFVRVDLFLVEGKIYFSELTFTPGNGMDRFDPHSMDILFGNQWVIDK